MKISLRSPIVVKGNEGFNHPCHYKECGRQFSTSQALGYHLVKTHKEKSRNEIRTLITLIRDQKTKEKKPHLDDK